MALHKLLVDDFEEDPFTLLAIHCTLQDFRMAYLLNKHLNISLSRNEQDLDFEYTEASYSIYDWCDKEQIIDWFLVSNICKKEENTLTSSGSLFESNNKLIRTHNLVPEYKNVNYLLKIENEGHLFNEKAVIHKIQEIPQVVTTYSIDVSRLKLKENLIFN